MLTLLQLHVDNRPLSHAHLAHGTGVPESHLLFGVWIEASSAAANRWCLSHVFIRPYKHDLAM